MVFVKQKLAKSSQACRYVFKAGVVTNCMGTEMEDIKQELVLIRRELKTIREEIPDRDMFLAAEESELLDASYKHEKENLLVSSESLRNEFGI